MADYEKMYKVLFNGITDAIQNMADYDFGMAVTTLIRVQKTTEEMFMRDDESSALPSRFR